MRERDLIFRNSHIIEREIEREMSEGERERERYLICAEGRAKGEENCIHGERAAQEEKNPATVARISATG